MAEKSIFGLEEFKDLKEAYEARKTRFASYWRYYKAEYKGIANQFASAPGQYLASLIQSSVKPLFTPLARAVNIDVALIPGDWQLADEQHAPALAALFMGSDWDTEGDLFVRFGVAMGESGVRIVDDRQGGRVRLMPVRPDTYITRPAGFYDPTPAQAIFITMRKENGKDVEYAEVIDGTQVRTFRNGELAAIGGRPAEYANALGFVPLVVGKHDDGAGQGEPTFDDTITSLDMVNRQATYMAKMIERHAEPQWAAFGAEAGDLEKSGDAVWFFPEGSDIKAVLAAVDFAGLLAFVQEIKTEMKESLPELAFAKLVGVERVAAATIELQMSEAVFKIRRLRKVYDQTLARAVRLAGKAAAQMNLSDLAGLDDPALAFDKNRAVISIDALTRLQIEQGQLGTELSRMSLERERQLTAAANGQES